MAITQEYKRGFKDGWTGAFKEAAKLARSILTEKEAEEVERQVGVARSEQGRDRAVYEGRPGR